MTATVTGRRGEKDTRSLFCKEPAKDTRADSQDTRHNREAPGHKNGAPDLGQVPHHS